MSKTLGAEGAANLKLRSFEGRAKVGSDFNQGLNLVFCPGLGLGFRLGLALILGLFFSFSLVFGALPSLVLAAPSTEAPPTEAPANLNAAQNATALNSKAGFLPEFPGRYFGMSREEAIKLEGPPDESAILWVVYYRKLNNTPVLLCYGFSNNQLNLLFYDHVFSNYKPGTPLPFDEFKTWADWLEAKYGPPKQHYCFWGKNPTDKSLRRTKELEAYYWEVNGISIQLVLWPPKNSDLETRNNKPYFRIGYYIE